MGIDKGAKIKIILFEISIGIMLIISLYYSQIAYDLGAKDCLEFKKWIKKTYDINISEFDYENNSPDDITEQFSSISP